MKLLISISISALALSAALATSAQAGCTSGCQVLKGNDAQIFSQSRETITSLRQESFDDNSNHVSHEALGDSSIFIGMDGFHNYAQVTVDAKDGNTYVGQNAIKSNSALLAHSSDDMTNKSGSKQVVVVQKANDDNFAHSDILQTEQGKNIIIQTTKYAGKNFISTRSFGASQEDYLAQSGNGHNGMNVLQVTRSRAATIAEQVKFGTAFANTMLRANTNPILK